MNILVTGSGGLIGSEASFHWLKMKAQVHGIDNNSRKVFFGPSGDISPVIESLLQYPNYVHHNIDIRNRDAVLKLISDIRPDVIIHCAAQPSHDKAASIPFDDFDTNAVGTFNLLEASRRLNNTDMIFIHMSTNKVYGDGPNFLDLIETENRYDFEDGKYWEGISESFSIDNCTHSLFGASKVAADIVAQEYGRYFDMNVAVFRGGCLTGPQHAGVELHGFLSYIIDCAMTGREYTIFGYGGKQVRDQIHSQDVVMAFENFINTPRKCEIYNIGGGKKNSASILEVIDMIYNYTGKQLNYTISDVSRVGDHICYYSNMSKFQEHYSDWHIKWDLNSVIKQMTEKYNYS